jgi:hypothetical protein
MDAWPGLPDNADLLRGVRMPCPRLILLALLAAVPVLAQAGARDAVKSRAKADPGIAEQLAALDLGYQIDEDGDYRLLIESGNEGRSQLVFVRSPVLSYGNSKVREIWSPAFRIQGPALDADVANRLLEASYEAKLGAWVRFGDLLMLVVKIDAHSSTSTLEDAIFAAASMGDRMEQELSGDDSF